MTKTPRFDIADEALPWEEELDPFAPASAGFADEAAQEVEADAQRWHRGARLLSAAALALVVLAVVVIVGVRATGGGRAPAKARQEHASSRRPRHAPAAVVTGASRARPSGRASRAKRTARKPQRAQPVTGARTRKPPKSAARTRKPPRSAPRRSSARSPAAAPPAAPATTARAPAPRAQPVAAVPANSDEFGFERSP